MGTTWADVAALVTDDEPTVRDVIVETLRTMGLVQIDEAGNGADALNLLRQKSYALVLVDLVMPGVGGEVVIAQALQRHPEAVVIVVTGHATIDTAVELMKAGAADLVRKPFDHTALRAKVLAAFGRREDRLAAAGTRRLGRYEILGEVARGGVGIVYRARDRDTGDQVALKILQSGREATDEQILRFYREAKTVQELRHPHIVAVRDFGSFEGRHFLVMEFLEGRPLDAVIEAHELTLKRVLRIVIGAAHALHYAHEREILHRDVKPSNILVDAEWRPHLIDFGLARFVRDGQTVTRSRHIQGTFGYLAPERFRGPNVDRRADIFALGVVLYEMLTGELPYRIRAEGSVLPDFGRVPPSPTANDPQIPAALSALALAALAPNPEARPPTARDLARVCEELLRTSTLDFRLRYEGEA